MKGKRGKRRACLWLAPLAVLVLIAAPGNARAATLIGQTFTPSVVCTANLTFLQSSSPGAQYAVPSPGVLTNWSFQAPAGGTDLLRFKVARPAGGNDFTIIGQSGLVDPVAGTLNSYPIQIPVQAGDIIGFYWNAGNTAPCLTFVTGYSERVAPGDPQPSTTMSYGPGEGGQLDVSANLETTTCKGLVPTMAGTAGNDTLTGTPNADVIIGLEGQDTIIGLTGNDVECGGTGKDTLKGGPNRDMLLGQGGKDKLKGGGAKDVCKGGKGNDSASACEVEKSI